jgi:hypothetical protein
MTKKFAPRQTHTLQHESTLQQYCHTHSYPNQHQVFESKTIQRKGSNISSH